MMNFTDEEVDLLAEDGYFAGYIGDIKELDLIAIPPVMRYDDRKVITVSVTRVATRGEVIVFIGIDLDNRPRHLAYGHTYPCFIKRES